MAERIVDQLEVVEVEKEHTEWAVLASEGMLDSIQQQCTVGEAGEGVAKRLVGQLLLQRLPRADVAGRDHDAPKPGILQHVVADDLQVQPVAVHVAESPSSGRGRAWASEHMREVCRCARAIIRVNKSQNRFAVVHLDVATE